MVLPLFLLLAAADGCDELPRRRIDAALSAAEPGQLWALAPRIPAEGLPPMLERFRSGEGVSQLAMGVALGLTRRAEALPALQRSAPASLEGRVGRALGLLALGLSTETGTIAYGMEVGAPPLRRLTAEALGRMPAVLARQLSYPYLKDDDPAVGLAVAQIHLQRGSRVARSLLERFATTGEPRDLAVRATRVLLDHGHRFGFGEMLRLPAQLRAEAAARYADAGRSVQPLLGSGDPWLRAGAIAGELRRGRPLHRLGTREASDRGAAAAAAVIESLEPSLERLSPPEVAGFVATLAAYAVEPPPSTVPSVRRRIQAGMDSWTTAGSIGADDEADLVAALGRLSAREALEAARARLGRPQPAVVRSALEVVAAIGTRSDVSAVLKVAEKGPPELLVPALDAAEAACRR